MSARDYLECDHCGGPAIKADADGLFTDGDGGMCVTCGLPGHVSLDSETPPYWWISDDPLDTCADPECVECEDTRRKRVSHD